MRWPAPRPACTCSTVRAKAGLGQAYLAAFQWALERGYRCVLEMDADWSHHPATSRCSSTARPPMQDLVLGSRWVPGAARSTGAGAAG